MIDSRFFQSASPLSIAELQQLLGKKAVATGAQAYVSHVADFSDNDLEGAVIFITDAKYLSEKPKSLPSVCLISPKVAAKANLSTDLPGVTILETPNPRADFATIAIALHKSIAEEVGYGDRKDAIIDDSANIDPSVIIGAGANIAADVTICANSVIGPGVSIGPGSIIGANVSITHARLGSHTRISSGARIGEAGFGFVQIDGKQRRIPQLGRVIIGDEVEIGANTTVDRGALNDTIIGAQTKIDNLVQIGHNCRIGARCAIASQTGISGSTSLGDDVMIGGQVGLADHLSIGDGVVIVGRAGLMKDIPAGEKWGGYPAKPARQWFKEVAAVSKLAGTGKK
ncbi:UDP-3-O-(3-hydroxymyristoyl)glucosamine N-acyltransferase [Parvularcula sp. IMCC14364]|uniref:UDP-3-O-(3-hydroxymyristoyl)glucosamine N-acyltransferase n=1 Tax=Parvularcula sp. IMCC14364 TaxID=3067902 RepID=UPI00274297A8|nr:UDP-3-O-(3-hydroxymyristoyl)glucosamine N-acyltransferase [Parvularcula sp. IMCC14364]